MSNAVTIFRQLHVNTTPLRLPNAWDAGSARLFENLGAMAIATTSAGMAWALGYRDGRQLVIDEVVAAAARMTRVLTIPLSFDIENGYSDNPKTVADNVMRLVDLGIAGINIEDGSDTATLLTSKIEAIRDAVAKANTDLFVNARSDVFLANLAEEGKRVEESIARGRLYAAAGRWLLPAGNCET
ncbi:MAG: isocitrate lyase/phosphoenolpyruvate mutase family protein [Nitrosospira sp.]